MFKKNIEKIGLLVLLTLISAPMAMANGVMTNTQNLGSTTDVDIVETINHCLNWFIDQKWNIFGHQIVLRDYLTQSHIGVTTDSEGIYHGVMTGSIDLSSFISMLKGDFELGMNFESYDGIVHYIPNSSHLIINGWTINLPF
ncbi:MAG: hypothetical protein LBD03_06680 [Methanobrevibacter sp.]|jgi:hypothetical protein|nr:hypothetical protein [Candidatus Methanovirga procula]